MENLDLLNYVEQARKSGMGDSKIREGLLQVGWPVSAVDEAISKASQVDIPSSKPKAMMSKSLALIFLVVLFAVGGYFAGAYYMTNYQDLPLWPFEAKLEPIPSFTPRPTLQSSPSNSSGQSLDFAQDWQTYRNEEYGFEFKYPPIFDNEEIYNQMSPYFPDEITVVRLYSDYDRENDAINHGDLEIIIQKKVYNPQDIYIDDPTAGRIVKQDLKNITIDNRGGRQYYSNHSICEANIVEVPQNNTIIHIEFIDCLTDNPLYIPIGLYIDQILSTFRFIE